MNLVLASGSPRRSELMRQLGLSFRVEPADVDESRLPDETPGTYVERLAREKARAVGGDSVVIGADTTVVYEGQVMGKPAHPSEARSMLARLAGDSHEVFTGVAVKHRDQLVSLVDVTEVHMLDMTDLEIADYVESGEPMDKAGAYALQGEGGRFVEAVNGSPFTVIGLPIHLIGRLVAQVGSNLNDFKEPDSV